MFPRLGAARFTIVISETTVLAFTRRLHGIARVKKRKLPCVKSGS
jgi:hypothetical protein